MELKGTHGFTALLDGVRVLDFTHALAGPFSTQMLADLGAEVIKVEPISGDNTRRVPPHFIDGTSLYFHAINRNKTSFAVDLKSEDGQEILRQIIPKTDVVMLNFSPGVAERLGISYEQLSRLNPRIITCTLSSFGPHYEGKARGTDLIAQAMAGAMSITGYPDVAPARAGVPTADLTGGFYSTIAVLAGLHHRESTGRGIALDTSLFHAQLSLLSYMGAYVARTDEPIGRLGSGYPATVPAQAFEAADGRWLVVDAGFNHHFEGLCRALERPDLAEHVDYRERADRLAAKNTLVSELQAEFRRKDRDEWVQLLQADGVPAAPVNDMLEALRAEPSKEGALAEMKVGDEAIEVLRTPIWVYGSNAHPMTAPPQLGGGTRAVLRDILGYDDDDVDRLIAGHAVADASTRTTSS